MALTSTTVFDVVGGTQTISFYESATLVDQITYSSNAINFSSISSFSLSQSDTLLYFKYLNAFFTLLGLNFPVIYLSGNLSWPVCEFDITQSSSGAFHIYYTQNSVSQSVYEINYVPLAQAASFSARSAITITLQEFFMTINMISQYSNQISLN
jgi:hypothetical protein